ncbi:MAG: four helix bundle protein [Muribaculaceae bacterium]|nr:four helix bundle protein [Muribaculaceae bacterium]
MEDVKVIKSKAFAKRIVKLYQFLKGKNIDIIGKQVLRSGTSIGANVAESVFSESKVDFKHKLFIALKEANETLYWLELLHSGNYISDKQYHSLEKDCSELISILLSIIKTIKDSDV